MPRYEPACVHLGANVELTAKLPTDGCPCTTTLAILTADTTHVDTFAAKAVEVQGS